MRTCHPRSAWVGAATAVLLALGTTTAVAQRQANRSEALGRRAETSLAARPWSDRAPAHADDGPRTPPPARAREDRVPAGTALLVRVPSSMTVRSHPRLQAPAIGTLPASSKYYHVPLTAWVEEVSRDGRWGRVELPYVWPRRDGWIALRGLRRSSTHVEVRVDLSRRWITVTRFGATLAGYRTAVGAADSPTPPGEYFVTDRIPFAAGGSLGSFAFGISGIQPRLPAGWSGGNQLAIHGTNDPSSIGTAASAGCLRVSEDALRELMPLLSLGTPVLIEP
jgi:lipoprotein-anchoring transpeptidase ErfK/SrfK